MNQVTSKQKKNNGGFKGRQAMVLHGKVMRKTLSEMAKDIGVCPSTITRDLKALREQGITTDLIAQERAVHLKALPLATARILASIMAGDIEASQNARAMLKGTQVWTDRVDVNANVNRGLTDEEMQAQIKGLFEQAVKQAQGAKQIVQETCQDGTGQNKEADLHKCAGDKEERKDDDSQKV